MSQEETQQREVLERFVAGSQSLEQLVAACGLDAICLGRWLSDRRFRKMLDDAMERRQIMQKMELMLQQSVAARKQSAMLVEDRVDPKTVETVNKQSHQQLALIQRDQRDRRRDMAKRKEKSESLPTVHPNLDRKSVDRAFAEMDRIDHFLNTSTVDRFSG